MLQVGNALHAHSVSAQVKDLQSCFMGKLFKYPRQLIMQKLCRVLYILTLNGRKDLVFLRLAPIGGWKESTGKNDI